MHQVGEYIVKAFDGVCKVEDILHPQMSGIEKDRMYYLLIPVDDPAGKIYLPLDTTDSSLRKVMDEAEARSLIGRVTEIDVLEVENERLREQCYKDAIRSCKPETWISLIKLIRLRKESRIVQGKKATVLDERYFKMAEGKLYSELGFALQLTKEEVQEQLKDLWKN